MQPDAIVDLEELAEKEGVDAGTDPYHLYARLREKGPVHRVRVPVTKDECWLVVGPEEARAALVDRRLSNDVTLSAVWKDDGSLAIGRNMLQVDEVRHARLRKLIAREFTARRVQSLRPRIQEITDGLVEAVASAKRADLVADFAIPLTLTVICELMGVAEEDRGNFHAWSEEILKPRSPRSAGEALQAVTGFFAELIDGARRREDGDDLLTALVRTNDEDGDRLSDDELLGMVFLLFVAGHETTASLITSGVLSLLRHPEQLGALRADWSALDGAIEEMLRHGAPVQATAFRFAVEPITVAGTVIPAGDPVLVSLGAVSRVPEQCPYPDRFRIHRPHAEARSHLAFGHGAHHCIGAPLARLEASIAIRTLLERCPGLRLADGAEPVEEVVWRPNAMLRRPDSLEVVPA
ncbi:cytochrome P450 [Streptomyces sp. NPDC085927]|uniref:cytochrome P450 n=1 Tax=Streptomyces sp. NPDC085927 TaxID=3365738 RepID=UPI0037D3CE53